MDAFSEIFQLMIQDHGRNPRNFGELVGADQSAEGVNPLTGDSLTVYLRLESDDNACLSEVTFAGKASALATTSASVMTGVLKGLSVSDAKSQIEKTLGWIAGKEELQEESMPEDEYAVLLEIRHFPHRQKCASLAWQTAAAALAKF